MIKDLTKKELLVINGGSSEITPENLGYQAGRVVGKVLMIWAAFFK